MYRTLSANFASRANESLLHPTTLPSARRNIDIPATTPTMAPKIHLVRHAQGEHNLHRDYTILDAVLTPLGKEQCRALSAAFEHHGDVDIVFASPLRRTIQTAALSFGPTLSRNEVPFVLLPALQELGDIGSDTGIADTAADLERLLPDLFATDSLDFDLKKIDASAVTKGWNSNVRIVWFSCM